jgi:hypothetical protein
MFLSGNFIGYEWNFHEILEEGVLGCVGRSLCSLESFNPLNLPTKLNGKIERYEKFIPESERYLVGLTVVPNLLKTW